MKFTNPKKLFKNEDSRFLLATGLKFTGIFILVALFVYYTVWISVSINSVYYESHGFGQSLDLREAFIDNLFSVILNRLPLGLALIIAIFFAGVYFGKILLRPFKIIGDYATENTEGNKVEYNPDIFSDYKLLTRFSEFFFRYLDECLVEKRFKDATIPPSFSRIRKPPFERVFFFHFLLLVLIFTIVTVVLMFYITSELRSQMVAITLQNLQASDPSVRFFFENQGFIFESMVWVSAIMIILSYIALSFHLYGKVSGAIFAFFSTMRSFMRGNHEARVHLIGYAAIRPYGRALNKYLDLVERSCSNTDNNEK